MMMMLMIHHDDDDDDDNDDDDLLFYVSFNYFVNVVTSAFPVKSCKNLGLCSGFTPFEKGGRDLYGATPPMTHGTSVYTIRKTAQRSRATLSHNGL